MRLEENERVPFAQTVYARDVTRRAVVEHELPRLELFHGNAEHDPL